MNSKSDVTIKNTLRLKNRLKFVAHWAKYNEGKCTEITEESSRAVGAVSRCICIKILNYNIAQQIVIIRV